jgi:FkbM family methyltransferase
MIQYSEHGEDTFLFDWIAKNNPNISKIIVDIGAYDGQFFSNSCAFIEAGWSGLLIEPHPESYKALREKYKDNQNVCTINAAVSDSTDAFYLSKEAHPTHSKLTNKETDIKCRIIDSSYIIDIEDIKKIGILSIDAEGCDTEILRNVLMCSSPEIIIIEANTKEDRTEQIKLLSGKYELISTMDVNTIWAKKI